MKRRSNNPRRKVKLTQDFVSKFIGNKINVVGLVDKRTLKIKDVYKIGKYYCFNCEIIKSKTEPSMVGKRENLLCNSVINQYTGKLIKKVEVLTV